MSTHTPARNDDAPTMAASGVPVDPVTRDRLPDGLSPVRR